MIIFWRYQSQFVQQSLIKLCGLDWTAPNIGDIRKQQFVEDNDILTLRFDIKKVVAVSIYLFTVSD